WRTTARHGFRHLLFHVFLGGYLRFLRALWCFSFSPCGESHRDVTVGDFKNFRGLMVCFEHEFLALFVSGVDPDVGVATYLVCSLIRNLVTFNRAAFRRFAVLPAILKLGK